MSSESQNTEARELGGNLLLSSRRFMLMRLGGMLGQMLLLAVACTSVLAVLFILFFIAKGALPFFQVRGVWEFISSSRWYPTAEPAEFGALSLFVGTGLVTLGAALVAIPLGLVSALCLSDVLSFKVRQVVKPIIEVLAAIPSVAFGFFALVVFAPILQDHGGNLLSVATWVMGVPVIFVVVLVLSDLLAESMPENARTASRIGLIALLGGGSLMVLRSISASLGGISISSGTNALNVSIILGIMALPTIISVAEDALQAVGRELREGSYALGATRAETLLKVVVPAASSGMATAVILGVMRAIGETMVVWMASGNAAQIPEPWFNLLEPVRTLTATIAGDMGEADHTTGSERYHVLFAMALALLIISLLANLATEWIVARAKRRTGGEA